MDVTKKFFAVAAALLLVSCQLSSPASRIADHPDKFNSLSSEQQQMVQRGHICEGMSKDAVFLAWGCPSDTPVKGQNGGRSYERWVYTRQRAVTVPDMGPCGPWDRCHAPHSHMVYVTEAVGFVTFENNRVTQWEQRPLY